MPVFWSFVTHELMTEDPSLKAMKFEGAKQISSPQIFTSVILPVPREIRWVAKGSWISKMDEKEDKRQKNADETHSKICRAQKHILATQPACC